MSTHKKNPVRSLVINGLLALVAFGLLGLTVHQHREKIREVLSRPIDYKLFGLAFAVYLTGLTCSFYRWYRLVRVIEPKFTLGGSLLLGFIGNVFNLVIPGAVGGDFIKAAYLVRMDINRTQAVASMVIDRIVGLLGLFILAGVAGLFAWPMATRPVVRALIVLVWCAVAGGLIVLAMIFNQSLTKRYPHLKEGNSKRAKLLREISAMALTYRCSLPLVAGCLFGSAGIHSLFVIAFFIVSKAIFPDPETIPTFPQHLLFTPLTLFTTAVPIPFGALGFTEKVSDILFQLVDHPGGALSMIAFRLLTYAGGLVSVSVYLANLKQVRSLTESAETLEDELLEGELPDDPNRKDFILE